MYRRVIYLESCWQTDVPQNFRYFEPSWEKKGRRNRQTWEICSLFLKLSRVPSREPDIQTHGQKFEVFERSCQKRDGRHLWICRKVKQKQTALAIILVGHLLYENPKKQTDIEAHDCSFRSLAKLGAETGRYSVETNSFDHNLLVVTLETKSQRNRQT